MQLLLYTYKIIYVKYIKKEMHCYINTVKWHNFNIQPKLCDNTVQNDLEGNQEDYNIFLCKLKEKKMGGEGRDRNFSTHINCCNMTDLKINSF